MQRLSLWLILVLLVGGVWYFLRHYELAGLEHVTVKRRPLGVDRGLGIPAPAHRGGVTRIASFNIQNFGPKKAGQPHVMKILADVVGRFDIVAIQEISSLHQQVLPALVELASRRSGRHYDYVLGKPQGRTHDKEQFAFVFDAETIEVDSEGCYSVSDPSNLLHRPPLVCSFRARGIPPERAFTFTLINVHTDPDEVQSELKALAWVYRAVRRATHGEDDVIMLGDLNADDRQLCQRMEESGVRCALAGIPTNMRGTKQYDNLLFHARSTTEFTGRAGVFDLASEYRLDLQQALEISDHLPVWAEFSVYEQALRGPLAARPEREVAK